MSQKDFDEVDKQINEQIKAKNNGQLIVQIIDLIDFDDKARRNPDVYFKGKNILKIDIANQLDKIAKEFPLDSDKKYEGKLFTERNILLSGDRLQWFVKYFGLVREKGENKR